MAQAQTGSVLSASPANSGSVAVDNDAFDRCLKHGDDCLSRFDMPNATKFFERALQLQSDNTAALDRLSEVYIEMGELQKAEAVLRRSTEIAPAENPAKWMALGQLHTGENALHCYTSGAQGLEAELAKALQSEGVESKSSEVESLKKELARAYCACAELFVTDLCMEEEAEKNCEASLSRALLHAPSNAQAAFGMATMRMSQQQPAEASKWILKAHKSISEKVKEANARKLVFAQKQAAARWVLMYLPSARPSFLFSFPPSLSFPRLTTNDFFTVRQLQEQGLGQENR